MTIQVSRYAAWNSDRFLLFFSGNIDYMAIPVEKISDRAPKEVPMMLLPSLLADYSCMNFKCSYVA